MIFVFKTMDSEYLLVYRRCLSLLHINPTERNDCCIRGNFGVTLILLFPCEGGEGVLREQINTNETFENFG